MVRKEQEQADALAAKRIQIKFDSEAEALTAKAAMDRVRELLLIDSDGGS